MYALPMQALSCLVVTKVPKKSKYTTDHLLVSGIGIFVCTPFKRVDTEIKAHNKSHPSVYYILVSSLASNWLLSFSASANKGIFKENSP